MGYASVSNDLQFGARTIAQMLQLAQQHGDKKPITWVPSNPNATDNSPQYWTNTQTGQKVYGQFMGSAWGGAAGGGMIVGKGPNDGTLVTGDGKAQGNSLGKTLLEGAALIGAPYVASLVGGGAAAGGGTIGDASEAGQMAQDTTLGGISGGGDAAAAGGGAAALPDVANKVTDMSGKALGAAGNTDAAGNVIAGAGQNFLQRNPWVLPTIGGAGDVAKALIQSSAISNAQKAQQAATQQALGINQGVYQQSRSDLQPYRDIGLAATSTLGGLLGLTSPGAAPGGGAPPSGPSGQPSTAPPSILRPPTGMPTQPGATVNGMAMPYGQSASASPPGSYQASPGPAPTTVGGVVNPMAAAANPGMPGAGTTSERMILMRAPTGETSSVPQSQVQHFQSMGAQVLGA